MLQPQNHNDHNLKKKFVNKFADIGLDWIAKIINGVI